METTTKNIFIDPATDEGVYVCNECANQYYDLGALEVQVATEEDECLCYNCSEDVWA